MERYICGYCGLTHTEGTKTIARHAKKAFPIKLARAMKLRKPFRPWQFYWVIWAKVE